MFKIFSFVLLATLVEAAGDAFIRMSLHSALLPLRVGLYLLGAILLTTYGTLLNLAPVDFATVTGIYIAFLFLSFTLINYLFFNTTPTPSTLIGGAFIITGGTIIYACR